MNFKFAEAATALPPVQPCPQLNYYNDANLEVAPGAKAWAKFMADTLKAQEAFSDERQKVDTRLTRDANVDRVEKLATQLDSVTWERHTKAGEVLKFEAAQAEEALTDRTFIKPTAQAEELRRVFLGKSPAERVEMMREAFAQNDSEVIAAITTSHKLTHGIDPEVLAVEHDHWKARTAPAEYAAVKEYKKILGYHDNAGKGLLRWKPKSLEGTAGFANAERAAVAVLRSYGLELADD